MQANYMIAHSTPACHFCMLPCLHTELQHFVSILFISSWQRDLQHLAQSSTWPAASMANHVSNSAVSPLQCCSFRWLCHALNLLQHRHAHACLHVCNLSPTCVCCTRPSASMLHRTSHHSPRNQLLLHRRERTAHSSWRSTWASPSMQMRGTRMASRA